MPSSPQDPEHLNASDQHVSYGAPGQQPAYHQQGDPVPTGLAFSIVVTLLCCMPLGIPAIVFSAMASGHNSAGRFTEAQRSARTGKIWAWWSFGVGLVIWLPYIAIIVIGGLLSAAGTTP